MATSVIETEIGSHSERSGTRIVEGSSSLLLPPLLLEVWTRFEVFIMGKREGTERSCRPVQDGDTLRV